MTQTIETLERRLRELNRTHRSQTDEAKELRRKLARFRGQRPANIERETRNGR